MHYHDHCALLHSDIFVKLITTIKIKVSITFSAFTYQRTYRSLLYLNIKSTLFHIQNYCQKFRSSVPKLSEYQKNILWTKRLANCCTKNALFEQVQHFRRVPLYRQLHRIAILSHQSLGQKSLLSLHRIYLCKILRPNIKHNEHYLHPKR